MTKMKLRARDHGFDTGHFVVDVLAAPGRALSGG